MPYGNYAINFRTAETLNFRATGIDDGDISDKLYISATVDNSDGEALDYFITITDGVKQYRADKGAGIYEDEDGLKYYGNVFSVPAGYKGKIYIPFNVWRGSVYGAAQNLPWDYAEGGKPVTVTDRIYLVCSSGRSDEDLTDVFGEWQYVSEAQQITKADLSNANLYIEGDADLVGGVLADTAETAAANTAGQAKAISVSVSGAQSFDVAGLAVRVKNISGADYGIRLYVVTADGKTFVGQQKYYYALIYADGTVVTYTDNNRNIIVPVDFDGTIIADFAEFATDNGSSLTENVNRREKTVAKINMYSAGTKGTGIMFGKAAWIGYRGIIDGEFTVSAANASNNTGISDNWFTFGEVKATPVVCENEDITLSENFAIYGTTEIFVNAKEGKLITSISGEGITFAAAENGYTATIEYVYTDGAEIFVINAVTANAATVTVNAGENGAVTYGGAAAGGTITVEEGVSFEIEVTPNIGFEATVTADGAVVSGTEGVYVIPAGTEVISVEFNALTAQLTVSVSGNGVLYIEGEATVDGVYSVEQGRNITLAVTPENGYAATVGLNGEEVAAVDGNYIVLLTSDSVLSVTFEPEVYSISYDLDRGENGNNPSAYTVNDSFVFEAATKEGYDFLYWYVISDGEERQVTGISEGSTGDVKVYAKFRLVAEDSEESSSGVSAEKTEGCFSSAGGGFALGAVILLAVATIVKKKKN